MLETITLEEAIDLIANQKKVIDKLTLENRLIRENCDELDKQRTAFAMKIEELTWELRKAKQEC